MHIEQAKLGDLFVPFEQDLKGLKIKLNDFDDEKLAVLPPESLLDATYNGDPAIREYITQLAQAVKAHKSKIHVKAERFLKGSSGIQLPDSSYVLSHLAK